MEDLDGLDDALDDLEDASALDDGLRLELGLLGDLDDADSAFELEDSLEADFPFEAADFFFGLARLLAARDTLLASLAACLIVLLFECSKFDDFFSRGLLRDFVVSLFVKLNTDLRDERSFPDVNSICFGYPIILYVFFLTLSIVSCDKTVPETNINVITDQ